MYLQDDHSIRDAVEYVRYAEDRGFEAVWQAESRWCEMPRSPWPPSWPKPHE